MLVAGIVLMSQSGWVLLNWVLLFVFYYKAALAEEAALIRHLPGYSEYLVKSGRFFPRFNRS
jgi:protein-S-isoprenylcysteine O-methyltransferase Ste14